MLRGFQQHRSGSGAAVSPPPTPESSGDSGTCGRGAGDGAPAAPLPQPGMGGIGRSPLPGGLGMEQRLLFLPEKLLATRTFQSPLLDAILGEKGRSRYINPSLDVVLVGADLGQVLQLQGFELFIM